MHPGKVAPERGRRRDEMGAISGSHVPLTNIVLAWNTSQMHERVERLKRNGARLDDDWLRSIAPAHSTHISFRNTMRFGVGEVRRCFGTARLLPLTMRRTE